MQGNLYRHCVIHFPILYIVTHMHMNTRLLNVLSVGELWSQRCCRIPDFTVDRASFTFPLIFLSVSLVMYWWDKCGEDLPFLSV